MRYLSVRINIVSINAQTLAKSDLFQDVHNRHLITVSKKMEPKLVYTKQNPKETANPINKLFFGWTRELFWKGAYKELTLSDLYHPLKVDKSERMGNRLEESWKQELQKFKQHRHTKKEENCKKSNSNKDAPRLERAVLRAFGLEYFYIGLLQFLQYGILITLPPVLQSWIINYFNVKGEAKTTTKTEALIYSGCLILCIVINVFIHHHSDAMLQQMGMKILRLNKAALTQTNPGQVMNLLSNDVSRFDEMGFFLHFIWITPIQFIVISIIIWQRIGVLTFVGIVAILLIVVSTNSVSVNFGRKFRKMIAILTDKRVQLMNELIAGIQVVKMYAWEEPFAKIVQNIRAAEVKKIRYASYVRVLYYSFLALTNRTVLFLTLLSFVLVGYDLTADITFMLANYFENLQLTTSFLFPTAIMLGSEALVSVKRLEQFLLLDEQPNDDSLSSQNEFTKFTKERPKKARMESIIMTDTIRDNLIEEPTPVSVIFEHVSANWIPKQLPPTLCNVSMKIRSGELCALVGPVGSGKSSVLHLILKDLPLGAGRLKLQHNPSEELTKKQGYITDTSNLKISYAGQEAWLFSGTVRENILFGQPYNRDRYVAVTKACALTKDFQQLPRGDMSNVGEAGGSLSGGQKARVNLARAVYKQADLYLLDDPLSAVDSRVARHLFHKCIDKYLKGKTRILVTHQLQFVRQADTIVVMDQGCVKMQGTYDELSRENKDFNEMINRITSKMKKQSENVDVPGKPSLEKRPSKTSGRVSVTSNNSSVISYEYENQEPAAEEESETGRFSGDVYKEYFHQGGSNCTLFLLVLTFVLSVAISSGNDYWVSYWTNLETARRLAMNGSLNHQYSYLYNDTFLSKIFTLDDNGLLPTYGALYVHTFCIITCIIIVFVRNLFLMKICNNASENLHNSMFSNILRAVMSFFHHNSSGRILNRFSKDVGAMDEILPKMLLETIQISLMLICIFAMIIIVNHWMVIPLFVISVFFYYVRLMYLKTAQNVKRLEGIAKSPMLSHTNATLNGLTTIRTSGSDVMNLLRKQFDELQDLHTGTWYMTIVAPIVFGLYLDVAACLLIACICFSFILLDTGNTLGGNVGLAISQAMVLIGMLQYGVRQSSNMVLQFTAVERILQYTNLPKEGPWTSDDPPQDNWPKHGQVALRNIEMKYDSSQPPVLKNLSVTIEAGWKVGIVGRTGAGKSSLISVLFRLHDETLEGEIKIDGRDTKTLGLHELRSRISIIPQQPLLFSESLRYNLDPFNSYDDSLLWESLREVELNDLLLDKEVTQNGDNLSTGQKQLICLARAILRNNKILVLDEATANIDSRTDALIQKTIRTKFINCTVITIAHRLHTIIDSDRIIVMDDGRIVEFGCPYELLRDKPAGIFSQMVNNTDASMAQTLYKEAEKACLRNMKQQSVDLTMYREPEE